MGPPTSATDSEFGAFVSVPASEDPLAHDDAVFTPLVSPGKHYFDQFTANAKSAVARNQHGVLDELLHHQDDPMYFLDTSLLDPVPMPIQDDDALADALMPNPKLVRHGVDCASASLKVPPLLPHLTGDASPPSASSQAASTTSLPSTTYPAHATLSRLSSSLGSLLPSTPSRPHSRAQTHPTSARAHPTLSAHGSPFSQAPYIPPTGAPGFAGDRAWDRGFSDMLAQDEKRGLVDPIGLGTAAAAAAAAAHAKAKGVSLVGRRDGTTHVLTEDMARLIRPHLPALTKLPRTWTLLYSLDQHGISLNTLYARCAPRVPSRAHPNTPQGGLLVIRDAYNAVFGAWTGEGIRLEKGGGYYGSGESFLWRYHPPEDDIEARLDVYKWTGVNDYVALCQPGFISFGGGDGHYGLYLDASLLEGSSAPCSTFGNPPLCGGGVVRTKGEVAFECVTLEVWGIGEDR